MWARRETGESCVDVSLWLGRIGYAVRPEEVDIVASRWLLRQDAARGNRT